MATSIEWTKFNGEGFTWNPIVSGCKIISEGCSNCYAMRDANRFGNHPNPKVAEKYKGLTRKTTKGVVWTGEVRINMDDPKLLEPLHRKKASTYFVNSMTDLFQDGVPFEAIDKIMAVIALCPQHTFQVLTKRIDRAKEYFEYLLKNKGNTLRQEFALFWSKNICEKQDIFKSYIFPLPNLWLGVSVENQEQADKRIPFLLETPAAVRFLSIEPLLEKIDLGLMYEVIKIRDIDWVIVGGESGKKARPMHPDWVRSIRDQCQESGVPFFFKQWGEYIPVEKKGKYWYVNSGKTTYTRAYLAEQHKFDENTYSAKIGKSAAGNLLDGVQYQEFPKL